MSETVLIVGALLIGKHRDLDGVTMVVNQGTPTELALSLDAELAVEAGASLLRRGLGMLGKYDEETIEALARIVAMVRVMQQPPDENTVAH